MVGGINVRSEPPSLSLLPIIYIEIIERSRRDQVLYLWHHRGPELWAPHGNKQNRCFSNNICYLPGRRMLEMMEITLWCSCQLKNVIKIIEIFRISRLLLSYFSGNVVTNLCHVIWYDPCHCSHYIYISLGLNIFPEKEKSYTDWETWEVFGRCINILQDWQNLFI